MEYIKLFESYNPYDKQDIDDRLLSLIDLGFEVVNRVKEYVNKDKEESEILEAKYEATKITLKKENKKEYYSSHIKWDKSLNDIFEQITYFCSYFEECYYKIKTSEYDFVIEFIIFDLVDENLYEKARINFINDKIESIFIQYRENIFKSISNSFIEKTDRNKLGETMNGGRIYRMHSDIEKGLIIFPFNTSNLKSNTAKNNLEIIEQKTRNYFSYIPIKNYNIELKKLDKEDIKKIHEIYKYNKIEDFIERYEGIDAIVINFNYKKTFDTIYQENFSKK